MKRTPYNTGIAVAAMLGAWLFGAAPPHAGTLTLRMQDAIGEPGGPIAIVLRTYASRPIGQGQVDMGTGAPQPGQPSNAVAVVEGAEVFSTAQDAVVELLADLALDPQQFVLQFVSNSASVNEADGPLAAVFLRLSDTVEPGTTYDLTIDPQQSSFVDGNGETIFIEPRNGTLLIRAPTDPILVAADAENAVPGGTTRLGMQTYEPILLSGGQVGIRYEAAVAGGSPTVYMDPRHGNASFVASQPEPGLIVVSFESPDGSLNRVPGSLVQAYLPISHDVPPGTMSPVWIDPLLTYLVDAEGAPLPLAFEGGFLEVQDPAPGVVSNLRLAKGPGGELLLTWDPDCGSSTVHGIYRGDLGQGYGSLAIEPGLCDVTETTATLPAGSGNADFFLVVPHVNGEEGGYGALSNGNNRPPASTACYPQSAVDGCGH